MTWRGFLRRERRGRTATLVSVFDQGVASITSLLIVLVSARLLDATEFGAFSVVFVLYTICVGAVQAHVGQELVLHEGERAELIGLSRSALLGTLVVSVPLSLAIAAAGLVFADLRAPMFALAAALPILLAHEVVRFSMSVMRTVHVALLIDALRLALLALLLATPLLLPGAVGWLWSSAGVVGLWGMATLLSLAPLVGSLSAAAHWGRGVSWRRMLEPGYLGHRFLGEFIAVRASGQGLTIALGALAGLAATGALRAASTLFGPVNVLLNAVVAFAVPILRDYTGAARRRAALLLTAGLAGLALVVTLVLVLLPEPLGVALLGDTWAGANAVMLPIGVQTVGLAVSTVMVVTVRMLDPRSTLPIRLVGAALTIAFFVLGYVVGTVHGAVWGLCAASWVQAVMLSVRYFQLERRGAQPGATEQV